jgi:hypothetical protein
LEHRVKVSFEVDAWLDMVEPPDEVEGCLIVPEWAAYFKAEKVRI